MKKTKKEVKTEKKTTRAMKRHAVKTDQCKSLKNMVDDLAAKLCEIRMSDAYSKLCPIDKHICDMELAAYDQLSAVLGFKIRWAEARGYAPNGDDLHRLPETQAKFIGCPHCGDKCSKCKDCKDTCDKKPVKPVKPVKPAKAEKAEKANKAKECPHCGDNKAPAKKAECNACNPCKPCKESTEIKFK